MFSDPCLHASMTSCICCAAITVIRTLFLGACAAPLATARPELSPAEPSLGGHDIMRRCKSLIDETRLSGMSHVCLFNPGIISTFLHVHPFGANIEYLWSYMQQLDSKVSSFSRGRALLKFSLSITSCRGPCMSRPRDTSCRMKSSYPK